jgi:hypothetical protein
MSGPGGAVVVDVVDGDAGVAELVESPLAASRIPVHVADDGLLNLRVADKYNQYQVSHNYICSCEQKRLSHLIIENKIGGKRFWFGSPLVFKV